MVFPVPGGPHRTTETAPAGPPAPSARRRSGDPGVSRWSWPDDLADGGRTHPHRQRRARPLRAHRRRGPRRRPGRRRTDRSRLEGYPRAPRPRTPDRPPPAPLRGRLGRPRRARASPPPSGAFGEGLFERLQPGDAPQVNSEARTGQQVLAASAPGGTTAELLLDHVDPASTRRANGGRAGHRRSSRRCRTCSRCARPYTPGRRASAGGSGRLPAGLGRRARAARHRRSCAGASPARRSAAGCRRRHRRCSTRPARPRAGCRSPARAASAGLTDEITGQVPRDLRTGRGGRAPGQPGRHDRRVRRASSPPGCRSLGALASIAGRPRGAARPSRT